MFGIPNPFLMAGFVLIAASLCGFVFVPSYRRSGDQERAGRRPATGGQEVRRVEGTRT